MGDWNFSFELWFSPVWQRSDEKQVSFLEWLESYRRRQHQILFFWIKFQFTWKIYELLIFDFQIKWVVGKLIFCYRSPRNYFTTFFKVMYLMSFYHLLLLRSKRWNLLFLKCLRNRRVSRNVVRLGSFAGSISTWPWLLHILVFHFRQTISIVMFHLSDQQKSNSIFALLFIELKFITEDSQSLSLKFPQLSKSSCFYFRDCLR